jgi:hypothetical protein
MRFRLATAVVLATLLGPRHAEASSFVTGSLTLTLVEASSTAPPAFGAVPGSLFTLTADLLLASSALDLDPSPDFASFDLSSTPSLLTLHFPAVDLPLRITSLFLGDPFNTGQAAYDPQIGLAAEAVAPTVPGVASASFSFGGSSVFFTAAPALPCLDSIACLADLGGFPQQVVGALSGSTDAGESFGFAPITSTGHAIAFGPPVSIPEPGAAALFAAGALAVAAASSSRRRR